MSTQKQTYVTSYTTEVDPRTLPDYDPDNYDYVPQAAREGSLVASSYASTDGPRQRKKYVTTTVTTVTTTTILLPKMQEAFVLPSVTEHDVDRQLVGGPHHGPPPPRALLEAPRALPPPSPHGSQPSYPRHSPPPRGGSRGSPSAEPHAPMHGGYPPSSQRQTSTSDSRREDSAHHLFPPGTASAQPHRAEGPGQNPYHSLPLRMDVRGPSSTPSSAVKGVPASAPVGHYHAPPSTPPTSQAPRSPHPSEVSSHNRGRAPNGYYPPPPPPAAAANGMHTAPPPQPHQHHHHHHHHHQHHEQHRSGNSSPAGDHWAVSREVQLNQDGSVSMPWVFNQNNTKAVTTTATYDRAPTLEELGITSYFANQAPARRSAPYVVSDPASGQPQPWIVNETREELEGGNAYRYQ